MQQQQSIKPASPPKRSFLSSVSSGLNNFYNELERGFIKTQEEVTHAWANATDSRFRKTFRLNSDERLIGEYWGQCLSGGRPTSCTCYVSSQNFCFVVDLPTGKANVVIPLTDIVSIQPAIALRGSGAPIIQPISDQRLRGDALQIFTRDLKLHQFFAFLHFDRAYSALVHSWQAMQTPPSQTYTAQSYAPSTQTYTQTYTPVFAQPPATVATVQLDKSLPNSVGYTSQGIPATTATTMYTEPTTTYTTSTTITEPGIQAYTVTAPATTTYTTVDPGIIPPPTTVVYTEPGPEIITTTTSL